MKHIKKIALTVLLASTQLLAQMNSHEQLYQAWVLAMQGQFDKTILIANQLTNSAQLNGAELGRAWIILGVSYREQGRFADAQNAFERSLHILDKDPHFVSDYSAALQNYGTLYNNAGQLEAAAQMWEKALRLRQQNGDHAGAARSLTTLAGMALTRNRIHDARKYLEKASSEANLAHDLTDDDRAITYETEAWLAVEEGRTSAALADYQRALNLTIQHLGERHWLAGWEYMLVGKAYAQSGNVSQALEEMRKGLSILDQGLSRKSANYFAAEIAYAQVLDQAGLHSQATQWRTAGEQAQKDFSGKLCTGCTINIAALR
jgi:tetratricopeptide (TPR) repeat protein